MKTEEIVKYPFVIALSFAGLVFLAMGISSVQDALVFRNFPLFGVIFFVLGSYILYLAFKINTDADKYISSTKQLISKQKEEIGMMAALVIIAAVIRNYTIAWGLLWPLWGTQPLVFMASVFVDRIAPWNISVIFYGLSLAFEGVYLYFISGKLIGIIKLVSSR